MSRPNGATSLPEIIMGESEYDRLLELAAAAGRRAPETAAPLLQELERATVVEMRQIPPDVVRLGSKVTYKRDRAEPQEVPPVPPAAPDIPAGKVSVLPPTGPAPHAPSTRQTLPRTPPPRHLTHPHPHPPHPPPP